MSYFVVLCTAGSEREGKKIAEHLVTEGAAACVNVLPGVSSIFFWEGKLCREREVLLVIKTVGRNLSRIVKNIKDIHSYSVPEILFLKVEGGDKGYLEWVRKTGGKKTKKFMLVASQDVRFL